LALTLNVHAKKEDNAFVEAQDLQDEIEDGGFL
jgi:hypothetical protein